MQRIISSGFSSQTHGSIYGILTDNLNAHDRHVKILFRADAIDELPTGFLGYILFVENNTIRYENNEIKNIIYVSDSMDVKNEEILLKIDFFEGNIYEVIDLSKDHIDLYLTGKCTQDCVACPQPRDSRKDLDPKDEALKISRALINQNKHINISGGEPTLRKNYFIEVIKNLQNNSPGSSLQILTNALAFSKKEFIEEIISCGINFQKLLFSIAIYGSTAKLQDKATGCKNSYILLEEAINNILLYNGRVELRIVINKLNHHDLVNLSELIIKRYKAKIIRVVFMGLEMSGEAYEKQLEVWIPFQQHMPNLKNAIIKLMSNNVTVYLYNYPLCYLPKSLWSLSKDSISYWKKNFVKGCERCKAQNDCAGFFKSTIPFINEVYPIGEKD